MAKSIRLKEVVPEPGEPAATLPAGGFGEFWEYWFQRHSQSRARAQAVDENSILEKAVNFDILAFEKAKQ